MKSIISKLQHIKEKELSFTGIGRLLREIDWKQIEYRHLVPDVKTTGSYAREIISSSPIECIIYKWPQSVKSAVHLHSGFWGYVVILEGQCENREYVFDKNILREKSTVIASEKEVVPEPDGVIHRMANPSAHQFAVSVHFYYPPLDNMDNIVIYDIDRERIGILNNRALTASWNEPEAHFKSIKEKAFVFEPFADAAHS